jgi:hypothetical protein
MGQRAWSGKNRERAEGKRIREKEGKREIRGSEDRRRAGPARPKAVDGRQREKQD